MLIEQTRLAGASLDAISAKYLSRDSIFRHMRAHVSEDLRAEYLAAVPLKELAEKAAAEGISVLQYLSIVRSTLMNQFQLAASVNDRHGTSALAGRLNETLRKIGRITGELMRTPAVQNITNTVNFINSPIFMDLQQMLIRQRGDCPAPCMAAKTAGQNRRVGSTWLRWGILWDA